MKLAEALQKRADLNNKISQLREQIDDNAIVQEGEAPALDPQKLMAELDSTISEYGKLIAKINLTNVSTRTEDGETLTELMAKRDILRMSISAYQRIMQTAGGITRRATRSEIKILATVNVKEIQEKTDRLQKEFRLTDNKIQQLNWLVDLQE